MKSGKSLFLGHQKKKIVIALLFAPEYSLGLFELIEMLFGDEAYSYSDLGNRIEDLKAKGLIRTPEKIILTEKGVRESRERFKNLNQLIDAWLPFLERVGAR